MKEREKDEQRQKGIHREKENRIEQAVDHEERLSHSQKHRGPRKPQEKGIRHFSLHLRPRSPGKHIHDLCGPKNDCDGHHDLKRSLP